MMMIIIIVMIIVCGVDAVVAAVILSSSNGCLCVYFIFRNVTESVFFVFLKRYYSSFSCSFPFFNWPNICLLFSRIVSLHHVATSLVPLLPPSPYTIFQSQYCTRSASNVMPVCVFNCFNLGLFVLGMQRNFAKRLN